MPRFLESRLRTEAEKKGLTGDRKDAYVYGTLNNLNYMHGSKTTEKGRAAERRHAVVSRAMDKIGRK